ncbi:MAG TPA: OB-fold domain-containing protein [Solirubrobacteraceae bacterium]|nr:OB-fold domain-containing protein [Solirubrobacteraceae bacterium]
MSAALTEAFWEAARRGELVRPVCGECGRSFFTPQVCCPHCLSEDWSYERSSGRGVVYSATVVHRGPRPDLPTPYQVAIVDLPEEGWHMLANLQGPGPTPIGTPVSVRFHDGLPVFAPAAPTRS